MKYCTGAAIAVFTSSVILHATMAYEPHAMLDGSQQPTANRPLAELMLDSRLKLIEQGLARSVPPVQPQDALILLATLKTRIETLLTHGKEHPAFEENEPQTLDDFEKLFWSMHVFNNQLISSTRFFDYAQQLKATARKYKPRKNDKTDLSVLQVDWGKLKAELAELREKLTRRDRDMRVARLMLADKVLSENSDLSEKLLSALALDLDGESILQSLAKDATYSAEQAKNLKEKIEHARTVAGSDLLQKSRWLFTGLHWWMRGRYGVGTAGGGFLKEPDALTSPDAMFGLLMPINQQIPTAPTGKDPVPMIDRRHHYLWQFETRQIVAGGEQASQNNKVITPVSINVTTMTYFY